MRAPLFSPSPITIRPRLLPLSPTMASGGSSPRSPSSYARDRPVFTAVLAAADAASWYCALLLLALILLSSIREGEGDTSYGSSNGGGHLTVSGARFPATGRPCDEIYVVSEGETLHTISDKCKDPYIVERNPHIHDPDDVFPGLVISIMPSAPGK